MLEGVKPRIAPLRFASPSVPEVSLGRITLNINRGLNTLMGVSTRAFKIDLHDGFMQVEMGHSELDRPISHTFSEQTLMGTMVSFSESADLQNYIELKTPIFSQGEYPKTEVRTRLVKAAQYFIAAGITPEFPLYITRPIWTKIVGKAVISPSDLFPELNLNLESYNLGRTATSGAILTTLGKIAAL